MVDWHTAPLEHFLTRATYGFTNPMPTTDIGPFMVTARDINGGRILFETARKTSEAAYKQDITDKSRPDIGDVLVTKDGTLGRMAVVDRPNVCINQSVALLKPAKTIRSRFLKYLLEEPTNFARMLGDADGTTIKHIYITRLAKMEVSVPELAYQDQILDVLASLDDKIDLNRRMNETLEEMARALFRDWFIDFGPTRRQMDGATDPAAIMGHAFPDNKAAALAPLFPARLGQDGLPDKWIKKPVGELSEIVGGGTPNTKTREFWESGTHLWATPRDLSKLSGVFIRVTERQLTDAGLEKVSSGLSPKGSVLMSSRAPIGYLAIAAEPVAVNQGFIVLRPTKAFPTYFAKLWCEANMETVEANANGSTFQEISKKHFKPILAIVPSAKVLEVFSYKTDLLFGKIKANEHENQTLAAIRDLLLPKLMSGEIQLKDAPMVQDTLDGQLIESSQLRASYTSNIECAYYD